MEHGDFILELSQDRDRWEVRARCSALSHESIEVYPDLDPFFERVGLVGEIVQATGDGQVDRVPEVEAFGTELYRALFIDAPDENGRTGTLETFFAEAKEEFEGGIRLRLQTQDDRLLAVPWELLRHEGRWLVRSPGFSLVRHPRGRRPSAKTLTVDQTLTVLGMVSSPEGLDPLDVEKERGWVTEALGQARTNGADVDLVWTQSSGLSELRREVVAREPHVFHFVGHGAYDTTTNQGLLVFGSIDGESADGPGSDRPSFVTRSADTLADVLDQSSLRLVILNACQTASGGLVPVAHGGDSDSVPNVANHLMRHSVDAVIAMQWTITERAAQRFAEVFYDYLSRTGNVGRAMEEARRAIVDTDPLERTLEWAVPQFYLRTESAQLFNVASSEPEATAVEIDVDDPEAGETSTGEPRVLILPAAELDLNAEQLTRELWTDAQPVASPARRAGRADGLLPRDDRVTALGQSLHDAVMATEAGRRVLDEVKVDRGTGDAARVLVDVSDAPAEVANLPWELLQAGGNFLSTDPATPVVRLQDRGVEPVVLQVDEPLRVLIAMADPADEPILRGDEEARLLTETMRSAVRRSRIDVQTLHHATRRSLDDLMLGRDRYHVLHFIGHGTTVDGQGAILLGDGSGGTDPLNASQFGDRIRAYLPDLRLVFLNSCLGAATEGQDRFTGLAQALVNSDLPAAIGMQYAIPDDEAVELSKIFYEELARGEGIDTALGEARSFIKFRHTGSTGWASPTLHVRSSADGLALLPPPDPADQDDQETDSAPPNGLSSARRLATWLAAAAVAVLAGVGSWTLWNQFSGDDDTSAADKPTTTTSTTQSTATTLDENTTSTTTTLDENTTSTTLDENTTTTEPPPEDDVLAAMASAALAAAGFEGIEVRVNGGTVTLSGEVGDESDAAAAVAAVAAAEGVETIVNDLTVVVETPPADPTDDEPDSGDGEDDDDVFYTGNSGLAASPIIRPTTTATGLAPNTVPPAPNRSSRPSRPAVVTAPRLDLRVDVVARGAVDGVAQVPEAGAAAWYNKGTRPGEDGSTIISGHVDYDGLPGVFFTLSELTVGDLIEIETVGGETLAYRVTGSTNHRQHELPPELFARSGGDVLHLITCGGTFDHQRGHYSHNLVVTAVPDHIGDPGSPER